MIAQRFRQIRKYLSLNQETFGNKLGLSQDSISAIETGKNRPTIPVMQIMNREWNVNLEWLMLGKGAPFHHHPVPLNEESILMIPLISNETPVSGEGKEETPDVHDYFPISSTLVKDIDKEKLFAIRETSDSMEPTIYRGDYLFLQSNPELLSDGIYILNRNGYLFSRRIYFRLDGKILINPDNNRYPSEEIAASDIKKLNIFGKVILRIQLIS
ncbi:MAG: helix-turn-helix domain-containing protein [Brevinematales bacterium]|nr:helix-turn-helix domain-containing protein [Brevinematales bacterium]